MMRYILPKTQARPRLLFAIDGGGALLSAILLGLVLPRWERILGMPREALYVLAAIPCLYVVYDLMCYWGVSKRVAIFLRIIALANLLYCGISLGFVGYHFQALTSWGLTYFLLELVIVLGLVYVELKTAARVGRKVPRRTDGQAGNRNKEVTL